MYPHLNEALRDAIAQGATHISLSGIPGQPDWGFLVTKPRAGGLDYAFINAMPQGGGFAWTLGLWSWAKSSEDGAGIAIHTNLVETVARAIGQRFIGTFPYLGTSSHYDAYPSEWCPYADWMEAIRWFSIDLDTFTDWCRGGAHEIGCNLHYPHLKLVYGEGRGKYVAIAHREFSQGTIDRCRRYAVQEAAKNPQTPIRLVEVHPGSETCHLTAVCKPEWLEQMFASTLGVTVTQVDSQVVVKFANRPSQFVRDNLRSKLGLCRRNNTGGLEWYGTYSEDLWVHTHIALELHRY